MTFSEVQEVELLYLIFVQLVLPAEPSSFLGAIVPAVPNLLLAVPFHVVISLAPVPVLVLFLPQPNINTNNHTHMNIRKPPRR